MHFEIFDLVFYGKFAHTDIYEMPVQLRQLYKFRLIDALKQQAAAMNPSSTQQAVKKSESIKRLTTPPKLKRNP